MLTAGTRLGPYAIVSPLGAGGMGEVYQARDSRLGRTVALKVLAPHVAEDPERRQRFEREARAISSLNHPHIAALYDIGSEDGTDFLVMECVEGQTLADRLKKGALPLDEALRYGAQIADALDKAHRAGIVHRDLKPSNIMLTKSGVKILDFGLAKLEERQAGVVVDSSAPTEARTLTEEGTILGTLQYMAPEQLEGKSVDARADLFALGGVLYEMVTGRRAFEGESRASLIAAILDRDPAPVSELAPTASPALDHAIEGCLEKDPDERWQSALDLAKQLEWLAGSPPASTALPGRSPARQWAKAVVVVLALTSVFLTGAYIFHEPAASRSVVRSSIRLAPTGLSRLETFPTVLAPAIAISPGGEHLAWVGERDGATGIYLRTMDEAKARWVDGTRGGYGPFFSPDGRWLGLVSQSTISKIPIGGGARVSIVEGINTIRGASWARDGYIYYTPSQGAGISRVLASGGEPEVLTVPALEEREKSHRFPELLPNGKGVLFTMGSADIDSFDDARVEVLSLDDGERRILIDGGMNARYVPTGHLVYAHAGSLVAVPFDAERLEVTGTPVAVLDDVATSPHFGPGHFAVSEDGLLVFAPGGARVNEAQLVWVNRDGVAEPVPAMPRNFQNPRISPDGDRVAVNVNEANLSIWIHERSRGTWMRLVSGWDNAGPVWEPQGDYIAFGSNRAGPVNLFRQAVDGSATPERLTRSQHAQGPQSWSPDGSILVFAERDDIWSLPIGDSGEPYLLLDTRAREMTAEISPDGRWLAYVSDESGRLEVYVQSFPGPGPRVQISTSGGTEPVWAPNGRELFYRADEKMMVVDVAAGSELRPSEPRVLFDAARYTADARARTFDVTPDGERFLMVEELEPEPMPDRLTLIVNWFDELESHFEDE